MVTGDRVVLNVANDGTQSVTVTGSTASDGVFRSWHTAREDGDVYAYPVELMPYVDRLLDRELFNVTKLVEQGLADRAASSIPLIVAHQRSGELPAGVTRTATLQSIDAVAGRERKSRARRLGRALRVQLQADRPALRRGRTARLARSGPFAGIERIYLDERIEAALAQSVPQIGAPQAWAAGFDGSGVDVAVLDTGIDTTHADLDEGKVVAAQNFTDEPTAADGNGHGTHVASTVAGSGQASTVARRGVAPGARLMNGKVLTSSGNGLVSDAIDAMEWATANGAEIVSMSLQAGFSDGTDPFSQAVNELTEATGVLFTIAAGNFGPFGPGSTTTPGTADRALTVGAVTKSEVLADFSSFGPRQGDFAIKPDITAPGVDIVAARAAGTALGPIVDEFYTMISGTSMATPHVAGASAILRQKYPDWTPDQLKAALVSTAVPGPYTVYQQGGGRVDVARAYSQEVYAANAPVNFGFFRWPHDETEPVTRSLSYVNESNADVTLNLTAEVRDANGNLAPAGTVVVSAPSVTVPAGGTAAVDVSVDPALGDPSTYGGYVTARSADGTTVLRTPVGFYKEPESYDLRLDAVARDGRPARGISWIDVINADDTTRFNGRVNLGNGPGTVRVPAGTYSVMGMLFTYDQPQVYAEEVAIAGDPELDVTQDTTFIADARGAPEIAADTDRRTEVKQAVLGTYRAGEERGSAENLLLIGPPIDRIFAKPTEQVTKGDFGFRTKLHLGAPAIEAAVTRPEAIPLDVRLASGSAPLDGTEQRELVYVGFGAPSDYQGRNVRGKAVLVSRGAGIAFADKVANATAAGAAAVILHNNVPGLLLVSLTASEIPVLTTSLSQGELLQDLLEDGAVRVRLRGVPQSPYTYDVLFEGRGRIPAGLRRTVDATNSYRLNIDYRAHEDGFVGGAVRHGFPSYSRFSFDAVENFAVPFARTEYVSGGQAWLPSAWQVMSPFEYVFSGGLQGPTESYPARGARSEDWFLQPRAPGVIREWEVGADQGQPVTREGNTIEAFVPEWMDPDGRFDFTDSRVDTAEFRLYEDGELIAQNAFGFRGEFTVGDEPATYRAELDLRRRAPWWRWSSDTETAWTFASAPTAEAESLPLLLVDYDLGELDSLNRAPRGAYEIDLRVRRQQGAPAAEVADFRVWASFDDGGTWRRLDVDDLGGGNYTAVTNHPVRQTARHVSLRVQASDEGGSAVTQTVMRAYGLE